MKKLYEIRYTITGEVLADNLCFDDVPELFKAYYDWYDGNIDVYEYRSKKRFNFTSRKDDFHQEWLSLIDQLMELGNIY